MIQYLAGFFDGEGCITIGNNGSLCLGVVNTNRKVLELFVERLGGTIGDRKQRVNKAQYVWRLYGDNAVNALMQLEMHLIEKQDQAHYAIDWMLRERGNYPTSQATGRGRKAHPDRAAAIKRYQTTLTNMKLGIND